MNGYTEIDYIKTQMKKWELFKNYDTTIVELSNNEKSKIMIELSNNVFEIDITLANINKCLEQLNRDIDVIKDFENDTVLNDKSLTNQDKRRIAINLNLQKNKDYIDMYSEYKHILHIEYLLRALKDYMLSILQSLRIIYNKDADKHY